MRKMYTAVAGARLLLFNFLFRGRHKPTTSAGQWRDWTEELAGTRGGIPPPYDLPSQERPVFTRGVSSSLAAFWGCGLVVGRVSMGMPTEGLVFSRDPMIPARGYPSTSSENLPPWYSRILHRNFPDKCNSFVALSRGIPLLRLKYHKYYLQY